MAFRQTFFITFSWFISVVHGKPEAYRTVPRQSREFTMLTMSPDKSRNDELRSQLHALDAEFDREMRARGFDPAQADNVALPSHLAALYMERERIRAALDEAEEKTDD